MDIKSIINLLSETAFFFFVAFSINVESAENCRIDTDCDAGLFCTDGKCLSCTSDVQCDDGLFCNGVESCVDYGSEGTECGYGSPPRTPDGLRGPTETTRWRCDESEARFVLEGGDLDGDGHDAYDLGGDDCDDNDANAFPGNAEICDSRGHDEDCDPTTMGIEDNDGDGWNSSKCFNTDADGSRNYGGRL